jgi:hypothetical protein
LLLIFKVFDNHVKLYVITPSGSLCDRCDKVRQMMSHMMSHITIDGNKGLCDRCDKVRQMVSHMIVAHKYRLNLARFKEFFKGMAGAQAA